MFVAVLILGLVIIFIGMLKTEPDDYDIHPGVYIGAFLGLAALLVVFGMVISYSRQHIL